MQGTGDAGTASSSLAQEPVAQQPAPDATHQLMQEQQQQGMQEQQALLARFVEQPPSHVGLPTLDVYDEQLPAVDEQVADQAQWTELVDMDAGLAKEPVAQPPAPDATQLGEAQYVLTLQQVGNFLPTVGSKHARQECRRLREWCLKQWPPVHRVRMTHQNAFFSCQCLLRSMHAPLLQQIFGTAQGIIECNFLLQEHSRDANYDGPRHVFEFVRTDGVRCHIHFHSGRKPDPLIFVEPWDVSLTGIHVETADYTETI